MLPVKVILVDINKQMVAAWKETFEENPEVETIEGSMLEQSVSAWVSPTNSKGSMDGGLDAIIKGALGPACESKLQAEIKARYSGTLTVGHAICCPTDRSQPAYLISTPTMMGSSDDVSSTMNVALACAAAFQAVNMQNQVQPGSIRSVALPGQCANTGRVPVEICADLMWTGYNLFREKNFTTFDELRVALQEQLGDLTPMSDSVPKPKAAAPAPPPTSASAPDDDFDDEDFDDFE